MTAVTLLEIYLRTLEACDPRRLIAAAAPEDAPQNVVAIGKCAGALLDGYPHPVSAALAVVPRGYPLPSRGSVALGGHPQMSDESFEAGEALLRFVDQHQDITFLISGGGSAAAESPLRPWFTREDLRFVNRRLVASGRPISEINCVRKHLSAIKGGRLSERASGTIVSLIYSDVGTGALADVASGPTLPDPSTKGEAARVLDRIGECDRITERLCDPGLPETPKTATGSVILLADNNTLTLTAARLVREEGLVAQTWEGQIETDVTDAAEALADRASTLDAGENLIAGGEPTVVVRGDGRGGRCSELAVRFALAAEKRGLDIEALFASSDGVDGNSGAAGIHIDRKRVMNRSRIEEALARSDSMSVIEQIGVPIVIPPTGNNLRDLFLVRNRS